MNSDRGVTASTKLTEPLRQQVMRASIRSAYFMNQLEGANSDPSRIAIRTLLNDYTQTTPQRMQALAGQYLGRDKAWMLAVIPEGQTLATPVGTAGR